MSLNKKLSTSLVILVVIFSSCNKDEENINNTNKTPLILNEIQASALNVSDVEIIEECGDSLQEEGVNCCSILPDTVELGGTYLGVARFMTNDGVLAPIEPLDSTYDWKVTGDGISISNTQEQIVLIKIDKGFTTGRIDYELKAKDGGCSGYSNLVLKK